MNVLKDFEYSMILIRFQNIMLPWKNKKNTYMNILVNSNLSMEAEAKERYLDQTFSYFSMKTYVTCFHWNCISKEMPMSTHNICFHVDTLQPLYNTVHYNMVLDITQFKDGSQKCIEYIEKWP